MRAGDTLRFRGPAGAEFVVTVGAAFDERTIKARVDSGEWTPLDADPAPAGGTSEDGPVSRPPQNAQKAEWVEWAVTGLGLDRGEAEAMTKAQLIEASPADGDQ
ncbi:hypothetical protein [Streptomyces sp. NPDC018031]|uniref:hypothetical protein n=1 Tax=Streptomyces sp. NPDC018031 TaxID=3365033 RepID=UPI0037A5E84A